MALKLGLKELQPELPNMTSDFYKELAKNYVYKKSNKIKHIFYTKPCVDEKSSQISFRF
tara:strand:+ start:249 stop:425 length:177 start_codon:yes stop_codon:yes gene_type:complete